jgi:hypothetical protein
MANLKPLNAQFVFFPQNFSLEENDRADFLAEIIKTVPGKPIILPIPRDVPGDIPFMFLQQDDEYEIQFSKNRIDITVIANETTDINFLSSVAKPIIKNVFEQLQRRFIALKDIGCVIRSVDKEDRNPNKILNTFIGKHAFFSTSKDAENLIRGLERKTLTLNQKTVSVNQSKTLNTGAIDIGTNSKIIICEFDVNTFPEDVKDGWRLEIIEAFIVEIEKNNKTFVEEVNAVKYE